MHDDSPYHFPETTRPSRLLQLYPIFLGLLVLVVGVLAWRVFFPPPPDLFDPDAAARPITPRGDLAEDEKSTIALFRKASPSVVHITNLAYRRDVRSRDVSQMSQGTGSGFVWDEKGYVVTNFHVVEDGEAFKVTLADHSTSDAVYVGGVPDNDLAVLRLTNVPENKLRPIPIGSSDDLQVGQKVFAIGNPFGLDQTLTTGVISGLERQIKSVTGVPIRGAIQTDAAINPGNSGGPLLDSAGRLIGLNTAIVSNSGSSSGIGFAMPVNTVNRVVPYIIRHGRKPRAGMGVYPLTDRESQVIARRLGLQRGVLLEVVLPDSAAARAGLRPTTISAWGKVVLGDLILEVDGTRTTTNDDLFAALEDNDVGDEVAATIVRDGAVRNLKMTLQAVN